MSRYAIRAMMKRKDVKEKTLVWWNISRCPVPDGFDPRLVRPRIESALNNSGYGGPLTITAIGNRTQVPGDGVLRKLSSTGIALKHAHGFSREWDLMASRNNVDRTNPANLVHGRSKEWDLLNRQDMEMRERLRSMKGPFGPEMI